MQNTSNLTIELLGLENKYWQAMKDKDLGTALSLTDFPCVVAGTHGVMSVDRVQFEKMFNAPHEEIESIELAEHAEVRLLNENTAIIGYNIRCQSKVDGKDRKTEAVDTSTWVKRGDKWLCAMHTETPTTTNDKH